MNKTAYRVVSLFLLLILTAGMLCACGKDEPEVVSVPVSEDVLAHEPASAPAYDVSSSFPGSGTEDAPEQLPDPAVTEEQPPFTDAEQPAAGPAVTENIYPAEEFQASGYPRTGVCGLFTYEYYEDGTACITAYGGAEDILPPVPSKLNGFSVTAIGEGVFEKPEDGRPEEDRDTYPYDIYPEYGGADDTGDGISAGPAPVDLVLPEGIVFIGERAFAGRGQMTVTFPSTVAIIADSAFEGCGILSARAVCSLYARDFCRARGIPVQLIPAAESELLEDGFLILPKGTPEGTEIGIRIRCPGEWYLDTENAPGTEDWLFLASDSTGEGDRTVFFTVQDTPGDDTDFKGRDTFATSVIITGEDGGELRFTISLTKDASFPNGHINTGDHMEDMIAVAMTQLGFQSSNKKADYDGILDAGSRRGDCNKYAKYTATNGNPWCASFVSWCFYQAGVPEDILKKCTEANPGGLSPRVKSGEIPVYYMMNLNDTQKSNHKYLTKYGIRVDHEECAPQRGDLIFFRRKGTASSNTFTHVGIVLDFTDGVITYIDGNGGDEDTVKISTIEYNDPYIAAWFTPW